MSLTIGFTRPSIHLFLPVVGTGHQPRTCEFGSVGTPSIKSCLFWRETLGSAGNHVQKVLMVQCKISDPYKCCVEFLHTWEVDHSWNVEGARGHVPVRNQLKNCQASAPIFCVSSFSSKVRQEVCLETEPFERAFGSCAEEGAWMMG